MTRERFKELGTGTSSGDYVCEQAVPQDHLLRKLEQVVDWEVLTPRSLPQSLRVLRLWGG